jgi:hypothetical protein
MIDDRPDHSRDAAEQRKVLLSLRLGGGLGFVCESIINTE